MGLTRWACPFFLNFSVRQDKGLGLHTLMHPPHFLRAFAGVGIKIIFSFLGLKGAMLCTRIHFLWGGPMFYVTPQIRLIFFN